MSKIENAVSWAENIARDDSHGYSQINRWGPDYDCSSLVISALEQSGIPAKTKGATYTGNMPSVLLALGFYNVISKVDLNACAGLQRGDILWSQSHTAFYAGNQKIVHASIDENGTIVGKTPGDQTGREICIRSYYNKPWSAVYRLTANTSTMVTVSLPMLRNGDKNDSVWALQTLLTGKGYSLGTIDSDFGPKTELAVKNFQTRQRIEVDGIVGTDTWSRLLR